MSDQPAMSATLKLQLLDWVRTEGLGPRDRFPTEADIAGRWKVGRSTVREALRMLENDGILLAERGRGRFLSAAGALHVDRPITTYESLTSLLDALGYAGTTTTVLNVHEESANEQTSAALEIAEGTAVVRLERLRALDQEPLVYSIDIFASARIRGPVKHINWSASLNDLLAAHGHVLESSAARLEAVTLPADIARTYGLESLGPWLLITETVRDTAGVPVVYARDYHRGERFAFNVARR